MEKIRFLFKAHKYVVKLWKECKVLSSLTNVSTLWFYIDFLFAYLKHGCSIDWYCKYFYRLSYPLRKNVLTHYRWKYLFNKYNKKEYIDIFQNKVLFNQKFLNYQNHKSLYIVNSSFDEFLEFIKISNTFISKPIGEMQGIGIEKVYVTDNTDLKILYEELKRKNVLLEEIVQSNPNVVFNNKSLNTIRVYTVLDKNGKPQIIKTILRVGIGDSVVDNFHAGGVIYNVDIESGRIINAGYNRDGLHFYHPGSDIFMLGYQLPNWNELIAYVKELVLVIPECKIIGWDVALTTKGLDVIEGNHDPDSELIELFGGEGRYYEICKLLGEK